jgi:hypothetical protein
VLDELYEEEGCLFSSVIFVISVYNMGIAYCVLDAWDIGEGSFVHILYLYFIDIVKFLFFSGSKIIKHQPFCCMGKAGPNKSSPS